MAKEWLDKQWECCGPKRKWTQNQWDKYHTELGQLICFVTDCWPNGPDQGRRHADSQQP